MRGGNMMVCCVKKRKGFFLWKGDFPVEEGLCALVYAHYYFTIAETTTNDYRYQPCF